jgi:hypothetical protein
MTAPSQKRLEPSAADSFLEMAVIAVGICVALPIIVSAGIVLGLLRWRGWRPVLVLVVGLATMTPVLLFGGGKDYFLGLVTVADLLRHRPAPASPWDLAPLGVAAGIPVAGLGEILLRHSHRSGTAAHARAQRRAVERKRTAARRRKQRPPRPAGRVILGTITDGDFPDVTVRSRVGVPYLGVPMNRLSEHGVLCGGSGSGKTTSALCMVAESLRLGMRVVFIDGKCSPATERLLQQVAQRAGTSFLSTRQRAPDGWRGDPAAVLSRVVATQRYTEPYYEGVALATLRLAIGAPGAPRLDSLDELVSRLDRSWLGRHWPQGTSERSLVRQLPDQLVAGVRLRYEGIRSAVGGLLDGTASYDDAQVVYVDLGDPGNTMQGIVTAGWIVEDLVHWATVRRDRTSQVLVVIDEFSRLAERAPAAVGLVERVRETGVGVWLVVQDVTGLGLPEVRSRILGAVRQVIVHRLADPEVVASLAGTEPADEMTVQLTGAEPTGLGSGRLGERFRAHPQAIRELARGEFFYISDGRAVRVAGLTEPLSPGSLSAISRRSRRQVPHAS